MTSARRSNSVPLIRRPPLIHEAEHRGALRAAEVHKDVEGPVNQADRVQIGGEQPRHVVQGLGRDFEIKGGAFALPGREHFTIGHGRSIR